jgi:heme exporter protein A
VGIEKRLDDVVRTLSRGLQQRVALARALLHRPAVFLYDEPYTGLDQNSATILDEILRAAGESGAAVFFASHDFERALGVCDRALILASGKIVYEGARGDWGTLEGFRQIYTAQVAT